MEADESRSVPALGIVMRPVYDRRPSAIVNHFAADFDAVTDLHRASGRDIDVVYHFEGSGGAHCVERLVRSVAVRTVEKMRRRRNGCFEVDPNRSLAGICCA